MKMAFKIDTGEMVAYGTGELSQWSDDSVFHIHVPETAVWPGDIIYTYDGTNVIEGDPIPLHDLTGS